MIYEPLPLVLYRDLPAGEPLSTIWNLCLRTTPPEDFSTDDQDAVYQAVREILDLAATFGFTGNLWQSYLTWLLVRTEHPFSLLCERNPRSDVGLHELVKADFRFFSGLFRADFTSVTPFLHSDCLSCLQNVHSTFWPDRMVCAKAGQRISALRDRLAEIVRTDDNPERSASSFGQAVIDFYHRYGVGIFGLHAAFRIDPEHPDGFAVPMHSVDPIQLDDLIGYENQKRQIIENTEAFVQGRPANNVLLYGDAGTGKSATIKGLLNRYYDDGLRMIEVYKHQFKYLPEILKEIRHRNYRFVLYMDDLSFEEFEIEYKYLKAVIEGGLEPRPDNLLIYATSNRRHLIRETWNDRSDTTDDDLHRSDTVQEKLSLASRFGLTIGYYKPSREEYLHIVRELAAKEPQIRLSDDALTALALQWEMRHGGPTGRTACQLIRYLLSLPE